ncbi:hypothetical protein SCHPADRAFT_901475 [Schizopora paradoxa]|uniref:Pheromone n=1 Tax=Schizopora paradoxa TaxID=27342 RepID=A0A0H2RY25_9AGAM|nr:hypothetical protein SCHPADRAFT_901475 [Schizopora paradoxa]
MDEFTNLLESFDSTSTTSLPARINNCSEPSGAFGDIEDIPCDFERDTGGGGYYTYCVIA